MYTVPGICFRCDHQLICLLSFFTLIPGILPFVRIPFAERKLKLFRFSAIITSDRSYFADLVAYCIVTDNGTHHGTSGSQDIVFPYGDPLILNWIEKLRVLWTPLANQVPLVIIATDPPSWHHFPCRNKNNPTPNQIQCGALTSMCLSFVMSTVLWRVLGPHLRPITMLFKG